MDDLLAANTSRQLTLTKPPKVLYPTGVAYVGQIEHEYMTVHKLSVCSNCLALGFQKPLKRCNGCRLIDYCSRECQKSHWPKHKTFCNMVQVKGAKNAYLSRLKSPEDVFQVLIDSYRLRTELDHVHRGEDHGIYYSDAADKASKPSSSGLVWADGDVTEDFQRYLDLAEDAGVLPEWWRFENRMECLSEAVDDTNEENIYRKVDQEQIVTRYEGDMAIRSALCIIAELIVGYDGKGAAKDGKWFEEFRDYLDLHPEEKARLLEGTIKAVKEAGDLVKQAEEK